MDIIVFAAILAVTTGTLGLTILVVYRLASARPNLPENLEKWLEDLSMDQYRPMMRLLDSGELAYLKTMPGFQPQMAFRLRQQRCRIFRTYLTCLDTDFQRICYAIKVRMLQSNCDRPDLAAVLLRSQIAFGWGVLTVQLRVALYGWGIGKVNVRALLRQFDVMRLELGNLIPASSPSAA